jgi:hypothetical protein
MARGLVLEWNGEVASFDLQRVERSHLYGSKRRIAVDEGGAPCGRASMTLDGSVVIRPGMTAQGWFTEDGEQVESAEVVAISPEGAPLAVHPSTMGVQQSLVGPVDPREVLDLTTDAVFVLRAEAIPPKLKSALASGDVFRFTYCYRPDPSPQVGYLVANAEGIFAIVGRVYACPWMTREQAASELDSHGDEELDFEMV